MARPKLLQSNLSLPCLPVLKDAEIKYITGLHGYAIDSIGRLWSCKVERASRFGEWHQVKPTRDMYGRMRVNLRVNGVRKVYLVHHLVASAFLGERPAKKLVCHRDGDCQNNRIENLYYGTQSENMKDAIRHGTHNWSKR